MPSLFAAVSLVKEELNGTFCLLNRGTGIADARADILLQTLKEVPEEQLCGIVDPSTMSQRARKSCEGVPSLGLPLDYFRPDLFDPEFAVPEHPELGTFPKSVVVLSSGSSFARTAYRHREHGYLVDPGGFWLNQSMEKVLKDLSKAMWFKENFQSVGKLSPEDFHEVFGELVRQVKQRTGAQVLVMNLLVIDPGSSLHNYRFAGKVQAVRRRDFDLALRDLSAELDFHILDVDRLIKLSGASGQIDFAHYPRERSHLIGRELYRLIEQLGAI